MHDWCAGGAVCVCWWLVVCVRVCVGECAVAGAFPLVVVHNTQHTQHRTTAALRRDPSLTQHASQSGHAPRHCSSALARDRGIGAARARSQDSCCAAFSWSGWGARPTSRRRWLGNQSHPWMHPRQTRRQARADAGCLSVGARPILAVMRMWKHQQQGETGLHGVTERRNRMIQALSVQAGRCRFPPSC